MSIELYYVPPGSAGFSETLRAKAIEGIEGSDYSGIQYLSPTYHLRQRWEEGFILSTGSMAEGSCIVPPRSGTLDKLAKKLSEAQDNAALISPALVPLVISGLSGATPGHAVKVAEFIGEVKSHFPDDGGATQTARTRLQELFDESGFPEEVSKRAYDALDMMDEYGKTLRASEMYDKVDALSAAAGLVRGGQLRPRVLVLEGFYEVTKAELGLVMALIESAEKTIISIPVSSTTDDLTHCYGNEVAERFGLEPVMLPSDGAKPSLDYIPAHSREEELEGIARSIKSAFVSGTNRDLGETYIAFPGIKEYRETAKRVLTRYGIPFYTHEEAPLGASRKVQDALSLLETTSGGFPRLATARFLTSRSFANIPEALRINTPGISLDAGTLRGKGAWLRAFGGKGVRKEALEVFKILDPLANANDKGNYRYFLNLFIDVLKALAFSDQSVSDDDGRTFVETLSGLGTLDNLIRGETNLRGFTESLRAYINAQPGNAENKDSKVGVNLCSFYELRGLEPRRLYLGGLKDGDLPSRKEMDFILPDSIRTKLGLQDMHMHLKLQGYIFNRLVASAGEVRLSYPSMEGDKFFIPSLFISGGTEKSEQLYGVFSEEEAQRRKGKTPLSEHLGEIGGVKRYQRNSTMSVTEIDAYRSCPRRFFIERVLRLEPPEVKEYEVEARLLGTIVHKVMEELIGPPLESTEAFTTRAGAAIDKILDEEDIEKYLKTLVRESFMRIVPEIYALEEGISDGGYTFWRSEYPLKGRLLEDIKLKGKVDRIDVRAGIRSMVIDYKTGAANLSSTRTLKLGATLQMFLYAAMIKKEATSLPESVGIYSLKDLKLSVLPNKKDLKEGRGLDHFVDAAMVFLADTVAAMREGDFRARPMDESFCRSCSERPYCPYLQGAGDG